MYKNSNNKIIYSASDLVLQMSSPFASWMTRQQLENPDQLEGVEKDQDKMMGLLAEKGAEHEARFLQQLKNEYGDENVAVITVDRSDAASATLSAMQAGYKVIFQAYLERDDFAGYADFLVKREGKSELGGYYYEAWDTKLSKSTKPYFIIQLCCYSWMLEKLQGKLPEEIAVVLGDNSREHLRIASYYSYFKSLKKSFLTTQANFTGTKESIPDPALANSYGAWSGYAKQLMEASDSLALVATIRKTQIVRLRAAKVDSLTQLAHSKLAHVKGISPETFEKLKAQAAIQLQSKGKATPQFKVIKEDHGKGLSSLPGASKFDMFFDIEGHPLVDGGLEYLWGVSYNDKHATQGKSYAFKDWWAHDQQQEKIAFEGFIDWTYQRWQQDKSMHVYHYASYEITAIRKISTRNQTRLNEVAELLSSGVFIDLYKVVKNGLLIGEPRYSIKNVEHLYRGNRTTDVANGGESIVFYENWRESGGQESWANDDHGYQSWLSNPDKFEWSAWPALNDIRDYNIDDCESTLELVGWLREQQQTFGITYQPTEIITQNKEKTERQLSNQEKKEALLARQQALLAQLESNEQYKNDPIAVLLVSLIQFYERERKPQNWSYYERLEKTAEQLFDDDTVLFDIKLIETRNDAGKIYCTASYNKDQPIRTDKVKTATIQGSDTKVSKIEFTELNDHQGEVSFIINADDNEVLQQSQLNLFADETRINTDTLENRLCEITAAYFETGTLNGVIATILKQANPTFKTATTTLPVTRIRYPNDNAYQQATINLIEAMDNTCLCIQGPPGAGKTHTAKNVITALVKNGNRIGIMSNSHAAIMNLLQELPKLLPDKPMVKIGGYKNKQEYRNAYLEEVYPNLDYRTTMKFTKKAPYESYSIIGATVYGFAKEEAYQAPLDYLFVDEASQVALANLIAVSGAAKNIVLMGDQMQLEQPIQGSHPGDAGASALEFMLKGHAVIPDDQGIFLERTYRMHPNVCQPLSEVVYEGKLQADAANKIQSIAIENPKLITKQNGILSLSVPHQGNSHSSVEEELIIKQLIEELKTGSFTNKLGICKPISDDDILVVAPYNMQVNLLKEQLPGGLRIGTIDKFQGQQAPIVIISMAVSDVAESSRGLDFIFDINRLNVAVSRAQALAIIVANKGLEQCQVNSLEQMKRVGFFIRLAELN